MNRQFPCLNVHLDRLRHNAQQVIDRCRAQDIQVCGVIKGCEGMPPVARVMRGCGAAQIGTSRLEQVARCRADGVEGPFLLIRIPGLTELADTVALCDMSLQSERATLDALEKECQRQDRTHSVIVMADLGDLREGFWDKEEFVSACIHVERDLPHVHLSYTLVHWRTMPKGINHLRIGENILLSNDLQNLWHISDMDYLRTDTFTLTAEVIEVRDKPTYPQGQFCIDAFGRKPVYEDHGIRRRALLALGRADVGELESLIPLDTGITVVGGSSDHCILDVTDHPRPLQVGDTVSFKLCYSHLLYLSGRNDVHVEFCEA